ncbi:Piso0_005422 [Millerozyma farinosa CBS 7064]|uniref:Piso0_005422 protein n=1 Tax=Pichia sorbitophila (strain ATCC MYA-4447 / BCRC 22081 / CBS 7064 / NBRC 10061 / NRRL Y-12695) TaxID=559304 RepID=G8Y524_PICSO|nr:Piso0_005422 [Millerozyma farinosa CBS 7064]
MKEKGDTGKDTTSTNTPKTSRDSPIKNNGESIETNIGGQENRKNGENEKASRKRLQTKKRGRTRLKTYEDLDKRAGTDYKIESDNEAKNKVSTEKSINTENVFSNAKREINGQEVKKPLVAFHKIGNIKDNYESRTYGSPCLANSTPAQAVPPASNDVDEKQKVENITNTHLLLQACLHDFTVKVLEYEVRVRNILESEENSRTVLYFISEHLQRLSAKYFLQSANSGVHTPVKDLRLSEDRSSGRASCASSMNDDPVRLGLRKELTGLSDFCSQNIASKSCKYNESHNMGYSPSSELDRISGSLKERIQAYHISIEYILMRFVRAFGFDLSVNTAPRWLTHPEKLEEEILFSNNGDVTPSKGNSTRKHVEVSDIKHEDSGISYSPLNSERNLIRSINNTCGGRSTNLIEDEILRAALQRAEYAITYLRKNLESSNEKIRAISKKHESCLESLGNYKAMVEAKLSQAQEDVARIKNRNENLEKSFNSRVEDLETTIKQLQTEKTRILEENKHLASMVKNEQVNKRGRKRKNEKVEEKNNDIEKIREEVELTTESPSKSSIDVNDGAKNRLSPHAKRGQIISYERQILKLENELGEAKATIARFNRLDDILKQREAAYHNQVNLYRESQSAVADSNKKCNELQELLKGQIKQYKVNEIEKSNEITALKQKVKDLEDDLRKYRDTNEKTEEATKSQSDQINALIEENSRLKMEMESKLYQYNECLNMSNDKIQNLIANNNQLSKKVVFLVMQLSKSNTTKSKPVENVEKRNKKKIIQSDNQNDSDCASDSKAKRIKKE